MINFFTDILKNMKTSNQDIFKLMIKGLKFSFIFFILDSLLLIKNLIYPTSLDTYYSALFLFKIGLTYSVCFIVGAIITTKLKENLKGQI